MTLHRITIARERHKFSCAHMTVFPDGSKERLHGHNFQVSLAIDLAQLAFERFVEFGVFKRAVEAQCDAWDERLLLAERCPFFRVARRDGAELEFVLCNKRYLVPADEVVLLPIANITVELLAETFAGALAERLGPSLRRDLVAGFELTVDESPGQGATFRWRWPDEAGGA
jgi:6-pyruvoyltetrahydropterin/6-carboxytetrahydropterin synthase